MRYDIRAYSNGCWVNDYSGWWLEHFGTSGIPVAMAGGTTYYQTSYPTWTFDWNHRYTTLSNGSTEQIKLEVEELKITADSDGYYDVYKAIFDSYPRFVISLHNTRENKDYYIASIYKELAKTSVSYRYLYWGLFDNLNDARLMTMETAPHKETQNYSWSSTIINGKNYVNWYRPCIYLCAFYDSTTTPNPTFEHMSIDLSPMVGSVASFNNYYNRYDLSWEFGSFPTSNQSSYGAIKANQSDWEFNDLYKERPQPSSGKGRYPGMPTSIIPLRNTFGDLNGRTSIQIYDESNNEQNCMFLNKPIGTIPYSYIDFTESGSIRIKNSSYHSFTHFAGLGLNSENQYPLIYRVTRRKVIAKDVVEIWYEIDGRKTFFQYYGINSYNPIVNRSTNPTGYEPFKADSAMVNGEVSNDNYVLRSSIEPNYLVRVADKYGRIKSYIMTKPGLDTFKFGLSQEVLQKQFVNQIVGINVVPDDLASSSNFSKTSVSGIEFSILESEESTAVTTKTISVSCSEISPIFGTNSTTPDTYIQVNLSGSYHTVDDFSELSGIYNMFVPYYGYFTLDEQEILLIANTSGPSLRYYFDIDGGNVAVQIIGGNGERGKLHQFVPMPTETIACRDLESVRYTNAAQETAVTNHSVTSGVGVVAGITTGAIAGAKMGAVGGVWGAIGGAIAGGIVGGASAYIPAKMAQENLMRSNSTQMEHTLSSLSQDTVMATGTVSTTCHCIFIQEFIPDKTIPQSEYYSVVGYPIDKPWINIGAVDGACYWLTFNWATIRAQYGAIDQVVLNAAMVDLSEPVIYNYTVED